MEVDQAEVVGPVVGTCEIVDAAQLDAAAIDVLARQQAVTPGCLERTPYLRMLISGVETRPSDPPPPPRPVPVRCAFVDTPIHHARINAVSRLLDEHGRLLGPDEIAELGRKSPTALAPRAQLDWQRDLEPPAADEGFRVIEHIAFEPRPSGSTIAVRDD